MLPLPDPASTTQRSCNIDSTPLLKILLHAAKYPTMAINGLLLGTVGGDGALHTTDAVPLFHGQLHLAMALETALLQVIRPLVRRKCDYLHPFPR